MTDKTLPPMWAIERAIDILYRHCTVAARPAFNEVAKYPKVYASVLNVAQYVTQHEQEPVDPLLLKAREIVVEFYSTNHPNSRLADVREGTRDDCKAVQLALHALRVATEEK